MLISKMPNGKSEIYSAFQGEGRTIGKPMVFVRLATCNEQCVWCDSYYTWNFDDLKRKNPHSTQAPVRRDDFVKEMSINEVEQEILRSKVKSVCFTGGEPTLQQKDSLKIINSLIINHGYGHFETETNGTLKFDEEYLERMDQINCSPKLKSSGNLKAIRNRPEVIKQLKDSGKAIFKFVVTKEKKKKDIKEIQDWQVEHNIPNGMIFLMAEGIDKDKIIDGTRFLMEKFLSEGYNISTRLQVILYGNKRAV